MISSPVSDGKTDGSGGPKHSPEEPSEGPTSGNLLHSRNVGHPTSVFSSMTFSQAERAASQRLRHGGTVVLSSLLPYWLTQNGEVIYIFFSGSTHVTVVNEYFSDAKSKIK